MLSSIKVIFENQDFLVLDKPAGLLVHQIKAPDEHDETLAEWLKLNYPETKNVGDEPELRPGIVHRLDKETSGVMVIAKNQDVFEKLKNKFKNREVKKTYLALVLGKMSVPAGKINLPIAKAKTSTKRTTRIRPGQKNSEAVTEWRFLKSYSDGKKNYLSLLEVSPKTGRTHQIRVHLAAVGHPVCGDYLYGRKTTKSFRKELSRIFLHANSLTFELNDADYFFESPLPLKLKGFLGSLTP